MIRNSFYTYLEAKIFLFFFGPGGSRSYLKESSNSKVSKRIFALNSVFQELSIKKKQIRIPVGCG
jgi:hypothetical protein